MFLGVAGGDKLENFGPGRQWETSRTTQDLSRNSPKALALPY